jgi:hypothetical protein
MTAEHGSTAAWLRAATRVAPTTASRDVHLALDLADVMPAMAATMAAGDVTPAHAQAVAGLRRDLPDETVRTVDPHLADAARRHAPTELRGVVTHVRHSYAPDAVVRDERQAYDERTLTVASTMYGTGIGNWTADPVSHEIIITAIQAASAPLAGDTRSPGQRRFDGLLALCDIAMRSGELPDTGGVRPHATIVVPLATILGHAGAPAAMTGYGSVISGEAARALTCDADISRVITGPSGEILDSGRSSRSPATSTAGGPAATGRRPGATRTIGCTGHAADPPAWTTECCSADGTMRRSITSTSTSAVTATAVSSCACSPGPAARVDPLGPTHDGPENLSPRAADVRCRPGRSGTRSRAPRPRSARVDPACSAAR